jgi:hypothetical protein
METISDGFLDNIYNQFAHEQSRILNNMKSNPESFKQNEKLHSHIGTIMKDVIKYKMLLQKIRISA